MACIMSAAIAHAVQNPYYYDGWRYQMHDKVVRTRMRAHTFTHNTYNRWLVLDWVITKVDQQHLQIPHTNTSHELHIARYQMLLIV
jgi:hypothetical protein